MPSSFILFLLLSALALAAPAPSSPGGTVRIPLRRELANDQADAPADLQRQVAPNDTLGFIGYRYLLDYEIAGQPLTAIFDTGSSTAWTYNKNFSKNGYDPSKSSTHSTNGTKFEQRYGDGSYGVDGSWFEDEVSLAGVSIKYPFGLVNFTNFDGFGEWGLFGFGPREGEGLGDNAYPTYMERLVQQGTVAANAFSMYVSDQDQNHAELLLGGIDTAKYTGPLYTVPLDTRGVYGRVYYAVNFTFEGHSYEGGLLDTGNPTLNLPQSVVDDIARRFGCWWNEKNQEYEALDIPQSESLIIAVGGVNVTIPSSTLFFPSYKANNRQVYWLAVRPTIGSPETPENLLGDPFLRQLFYTIDKGTETFAFAPVRYTSESNIVAVAPSGIPDTQPAPIQYSNNGTYAGELNSTRATNPQCKLVNAC